MDDISGDLTNSCPINERNMYILQCFYFNLKSFYLYDYRIVQYAKFALLYDY